MSDTMIAAAPRTAGSTRARSGLGHGPGFWIIAAAFTVAMAFSTVPTPLYALYKARDGFPTIMITVIFAAYAVGVSASLYLAGHVSDWLGRRRVILVALLLEIVSASLFLLWPEVPGLIIARFVCGFGIGVLTATATAHLSELRAVARPGEDRARTGIISTAVNLGGLALGPLAGGALAQYVSSPLTVPYVIFLLLLSLSAVGVGVVPETVERSKERPAYRPQRVSIPESARSTFWAAAIGAFAAFGILGLFTSLAPTLVAGSMHQTSRLVAGTVAFAVFAAAAVAQILLAGLPQRAQLKLGTVLMSIGLVGISSGGLTADFWLFLLSGVVAGAGAGLIFRSSIGTAASLASPGRTGEVLAAIFLAGYVGLAIPVLAIGVTLTVVSDTTALALFSAAMLALSLYSGLRILAHR